ncbi:MAG TPA: hypothetical protein VLK27_07940 [Chthoniobacterales bacterium]|nr:hypothetical protein [Chthoniobacterales bacterium]
MDDKRLQVDQPEAYQRHQGRYNRQKPPPDGQPSDCQQAGDYYRSIGHCPKAGQGDTSNALSVPASKNGGAFVAATNVAALKMFYCQIAAVD